MLSILWLLLVLSSCETESSVNEKLSQEKMKGFELVVLGTIQDAGSPQIACNKGCCKGLFKSPENTRKVSSLGIIDYDNQKTYLFDATPDMPSQIELLTKSLENKEKFVPDGVFLTHAHMGHYTGLIHFGREALGANKIPVYAMPKMANFLKNNGPWSQLIELENILIQKIDSLEQIQLGLNLSIFPIVVPHRDEFSETVGYQINGPNKKVLFIPDIDKWTKWDQDIIEWIKKVDYAFIDATFYDGAEINNRDISEIPHPFVVESIKLFQDLSLKDKSKIHFIHLNHTNPLLKPNSNAYLNVKDLGFEVAQFNQRVKL